MKTIENTLIDNSKDFMLVDYLHDIIQSGDCNHIRIATGYWDLPGMKLLEDVLKDFLGNGGRLDILIGQEPELRTYQLRKDLTPEERFPDFYIQRDINKLNEDYVGVAQLLLDNINPDDEDVSKIRIRVYGQDTKEKHFLHAKCYIFTGSNYGVGIVGSSNFTHNGLTENAELNYLESDKIKVRAILDEDILNKTHVMWFNELWNDSVPWSGKFIKEILMKAPVVQGIKDIKSKDVPQTPLTPYELYIKLLHYQFGDMIDVNKSQIISSYLPEQFTPLEYQMDAVKQCFNIMQTHGGFMLADVVGLGKTIVGTLVIKYFLNYPDADHAHKVLIITPPSIKSAWVETIREFDKNSDDHIEPFIDFITVGSIKSISGEEIDEGDTGEFDTKLNYCNYGLIMIDESHKFRNSDTNMYHALDDLIAQIYDKTFSYPYIGLLSATPQNNTPRDLKNQIYLFERNRQYCSLEKVDGRNLEAYFSGVISSFDALRKEANFIAGKKPKTLEDIKREEEIRKEFQKIASSIRDTILCDILVRRTRTDIKEYYSKDIEKQGLRFPEISGPHSLRYVMDDELAQLFADTMDMIAPSEDTKMKTDKYLRYFRYRAPQYLLKEEDRDRYKGRGTRDADSLAEQLAKIMQQLLVKRLESSFSAFTKSLQNLRKYTENMKRMWDNNTIFICPQINVNDELDIKAKEEKYGKPFSFEDCLNDLRNKIEKLTKDGRNEKGQNREYTRDDFKPEYRKLLDKDFELISDLYDRWCQNSEDPKLDEFKESLKPILFDPDQNRPQKLVIFSEAIDTVKALKRAVENKGYKVLMITADNREKNEQKIRENFDANYKGDWKNDYQVIITTEVLAEGINLHRANVILNYDTPWNSTRLMQRIGRVNRIGSSEPFVYVYNFMPSAQGDRMIQLVEKAHIKLQSFHTLFGEDAKVFTENEEVAHYKLKEFVDGEESPFEKYIFELKRYREANPKRYEYIIGKNDDLQMAVSDRSGDNYLVVRTPKTKGLFVHVASNGKGSIIRALDMFPAFYSDEMTVREALPEDWEHVKKTAIQTFGQHLAKITSYKVKDKAATNAKGIVMRLIKEKNLSNESQRLLDAAFNMIRKGNKDIIRIILAIGEEVFGETENLFKINQEDIDSIISKRLDKIVDEQTSQLGKPEVFIGLAK